jgi:VanZ family protein
MLFLLWLVYILIAYGSLFPFDFTFIADDNPLGTVVELPSVGDVLGNILLFVPLGLLHRMQISATTKGPKFAQLLLYIGCYATALQVLQFFLPTRDQNLYDVVFNCIGFSLGWFGYRSLMTSHYKPNNYIAILPIGVSCLFFISELIPLIPSVDFQLIKNSLKPLLSGTFNLVDIVSALVFWTLSFRLIDWQRKRVPFTFLMSIWLVFVIAKVITHHNYLTVTDIVSPLFALAIYRLQPFRTKNSIMTLAIVVLFSYLLISIEMFSSFGTQLFNFIPFNEFLSGNLETNTRNIFFKSFVFCGLFWLALEANLNLKKTAWVLFSIILLIEILQLWMPTKTPGISDAILVLLCFALVRYIGDFLATRQDQNELSSEREEELETLAVESTGNFSGLDTRFGLRIPSIRLVLALALPFAAFYMGIQFILSLPNIPYNVLELFRRDGSFFDIFCFYIAILALFIGSIWAGKYLALGQRSFVFSPLIILGVSSVSFTFLWSAITRESLFDFLGSSVFVHRVAEREVLGADVAKLVLEIGPHYFRPVIEVIEPYIRYWALFGPLMMMTSLLASFYFCRDKGDNTITAWKFLFRSALVYLPWLFVCKVIAFDWSSTDNLNELIARSYENFLPINGGPFLYALLVLMIFSGVIMGRGLTSQQASKILGSLAVVLITIPLTWWLLNHGLTQEFTKYQITFSGVDFLLGPDRRNKLTNLELFSRWAFVHCAVVCVVAFSLTQFYQFSQNKPLLLALKTNASIHLIKFLTLFSVLGLSGVYVLLGLFDSAYPNTNKTFDRVEIEKIDVSKNLTPKPGNVFLDNRLMPNLTDAIEQAKDNSIVTIEAGLYNEAATLSANNVQILAQPGAVIYGKAKDAKAAIVVTGNNAYIKGLECHSVAVADNNGSCVRAEGIGITLDGVYFHHAQGGLLGSYKGGDIYIFNSKFSYLGNGSFFHGVYTFEKTRLFIENSEFLNNQNGGHEIKSRSSHTEIRNSIVANTQTRDSRLVDVPNGGVLILTDNIFVEGPYSENNDLFSWGVEGVKHEVAEVTIKDNLIINDKSYANLISFKQYPNRVNVFNNVVVGSVNGMDKELNIFLKDREEANIKPAPFIPSLQPK